jgi:putative flippase GtrA
MNGRTAAYSTSADLRQFYRFAIVGCLNVMVSFAVFILCYEVWPLASNAFDLSGNAGAWVRSALTGHGIPSVDAAVANVVGYGAGMVNSFVLNKTWTFRAQGNTLLQMHRFFILNLLGLLLSTLLLFLFVDLLHGPYLVVWAIATAVVMVLNFYGNKFWTFGHGHHRKASP